MAELKSCMMEVWTEIWRTLPHTKIPTGLGKEAGSRTFKPWKQITCLQDVQNGFWSRSIKTVRGSTDQEAAWGGSRSCWP